MSVFNERIEWLSQSIDSIIKQTFHDYEFIIVVDNPNIDSSIRSFLKSKAASDSRIKIFFNDENLGLALSLNKAVSFSSGTFIARMDADDISFPERISKELEYLDRTKADLVSTNFIYIDDKSNIIRVHGTIEENQNKILPKKNQISHPTVVFKKECFDIVGGYRNFQRSQDYDLWLRFLTNGFSIRAINEYLLYYRINPSGLSEKSRLEQYYTNLYQKKLYLERKKYGTDSFSEEKYRKYIESKKINSKKERRFKLAMKYLDLAIIQKKNVFLFLIYCGRAFFLFPSFFLNKIKC